MISRADGWGNLLSGIGTATYDKRLSTSFDVDIVTPEEATDIYRGDDLAARIVETVPNEMLRQGFSLVIAPEDDPGVEPELAALGPDGKPLPPESGKPAPFARQDLADTYELDPGPHEGDDPAPTDAGDPEAGVDDGQSMLAQGEPEEDPGVELTKKVTAKWEDLGLEQALHEALCYERAYGGAAILLGADDGSTDLTIPLDIKKVRKFEWLTVLDPREIMPLYWYNDPTQPKFGKPSVYQLCPVSPGAAVDGSTYTKPIHMVHESRLVVFEGISVSRRLSGRSSSAGWGDSVFTRVKHVLADFNVSWSAAGLLVHDFAQAVFKIKGLAELVVNDPQSTFKTRMQMVEMSRSTARAVVIDAEEEFERKQTPVSGLPELLDRFMTRLAAAADMPLTLLMGESPGGLNATGDSDLRFFYDRIKSAQKRKALPAIKRITQLIMATMGGEPDDWSIEFAPLWQPSEKEQADTRQVQMQTDTGYINAGVLSPEEVAIARFKSDTWSGATVIDFDARKMLEAAAPKPVAKPGEDPNAAPPPMGGVDPETGKPLPALGPDGKPLPVQEGQPPEDEKKAGGFPFGKKPWGGGGQPPFARGDYSEDQPRAEDGRFGEVAGSAGRSRVGDESGGHPPKPGERFKVMRLADREGLAGTNAGNAAGVADYLMAIDDPEKASQSSASLITVYDVSVESDFGAYAAQVRGKSTVNEQESGRVGRSEHKSWNELITYSFPADGKGFTSERSTSFSVSDVLAELRASTPYKSFAEAGHKEVMEAVRSAAAKSGKSRADYDPDQPRVPAGEPGGGQFGEGGGGGGGAKAEVARAKAVAKSGRMHERAARKEPAYMSVRWERVESTQKAIEVKPTFNAKPDPEHKTLDTEAAHKQGDGQWTPERVELHDAYTAAVTNNVPVSNEPIVFMTGGGPAAGKSTAILNNRAAGVPSKDAAAHINPDDAKSTLPEYRAGVEAGDEKAAAATHEESSHMAKSAHVAAIEAGHDTVLDAVGDSGIDKLHSKIEAMREAGAKKIVARYATCDVDNAAARAIARGEKEGRVVNEGELRRMHADVSRTVQAAIERGTFDDLKVYDTDVPLGATPPMIASYTRAGGLTVHNERLWESFKARGTAVASSKKDAEDHFPVDGKSTTLQMEGKGTVNHTKVYAAAIRGGEAPPGFTSEERAQFEEYKTALAETRAKHPGALLYVPDELPE